MCIGEVPEIHVKLMLSVGLFTFLRLYNDTYIQAINTV